MDVFERVREVGTGVSLADEQISGARARLLEGIDTGTAMARKRVSRRPMFLIAGAVAGVAAATATVMVVGQLTAPAPQVEAIPAPTVDPRQPGEVLPHPAPTGGTGITEPFPGTTPQAGQYLSIQTTTDTLMYQDVDGTYFGYSYASGTNVPASAVVLRAKSGLLVPADRSGEWHLSTGPINERRALFPDTPDNANVWAQAMPPSSEVLRGTSLGAFPSDVGLASGSEESYQDIPADPDALIPYLRELLISKWSVDPAEADELVWASIVDTLTTNFAPAATRATFLEALSSHAETISVEGSIVTYRLRYSQSGTARTVDVSIDTATGWATEASTRWDRPSGAQDPVPRTVPDLHETFTVSIVDSIP